MEVPEAVVPEAPETAEDAVEVAPVVTEDAEGATALEILLEEEEEVCRFAMSA